MALDLFVHILLKCCNIITIYKKEPNSLFSLLKIFLNYSLSFLIPGKLFNTLIILMDQLVGINKRSSFYFCWD